MNLELIASTPHGKPVLRQHLSIVAYLQNYYDYRKSKDTGFSYEQWALEFGFKSRSSLRMMCVGRRAISNKLVENFCRKEKFTSAESEYMHWLARLQNAKSAAVKKIYLEKIIEFVDFNFQTVEVKNALEFLTNPDLTVVLLLTAFTDFTADEVHLKSATGFSKLKIRSLLQTLKKLDLIELRGLTPTVWKSKNKFLRITDELQDEAISIFHLHTAQEAKGIIGQNILDKKMKSLLFSLGESEFADLVETIDQFVNKLKVKYANDFVKEKKIYKINLQAYPVTEKLG